MGSRAMRNLFPDFPREPVDTDYIVPKLLEDEKYGYNGSGYVEYHEIPPFNYKFVDEDSDDELTADELYTLKVSHLFWDIKWDKNMFDVVFLNNKGAKLIEPLFLELYAHWLKVHGEPRRSNLTLTKDEFFDNALECPHDHDMITEECWEIVNDAPYLDLHSLKRLAHKKIKQIYVDILNDSISVADMQPENS